MHPDGTQSSPEVVSQGNFPMDADMAQSKTRVNARSVGRGRGRGRDSQATAGAIATQKKNYRPAQVVLDHMIQRRTSEQVKADQAKAKADAAAAKAAATAHLQSQKDQVAALEDSMQDEAYTQSQEELRPDLHINYKSASNTEVETLSDSHMLDDPIGIPCEPLTVRDLPPDQSSYRDSSHGKEFLTGWEELDDQDQDYVMPSGNESDASQASKASQDLTQKTRSKAKFKPQVSDFRAAVNEARQVPPPSQPKKRKGPEPPPPVEGNTSTKRTKTSEPGGLVPNWKKKTDLSILEHIACKHPVEFINTDDEAEAEFNKPEWPAMMAAVRATKPPTVKIEKKLIGVKFAPRPLYRTPNNTQPKQNKVMVDDLPFPHPRTQYNAKWQKLFRPTLLSWASTFPDPYATNTLLDETILLEMWDIIYPDIDLDEEDRMDAGVKLIYLAGNILHDWHTTIGTGALNVVKNHFLLPANGFNKEQIVKFVRWCLDPKKFNFIYGAPNAEAV
ncbi:hypothetical protein V8E52_008392 [Russula decolorans]